MSMFYDPKKRQVRPWIFVPFVLIPVVIVIVVVIVGKGRLQIEKETSLDQSSSDVFEKF